MRISSAIFSRRQAVFGRSATVSRAAGSAAAAPLAQDTGNDLTRFSRSGWLRLARWAQPRSVPTGALWHGETSLRVTGGDVRAQIRNPQSAIRNEKGFTLVEIAICIAIISVALVGIIAVLPLGMNAQRDTREETLISQDAAMLLPIITRGAYNTDDLTNYVYAITNYWTLYKPGGVVVELAGVNGYTYTNVSTEVLKGTGSLSVPPYSLVPLTNGLNIVGLLSTPEFIANVSGIPDYPAVPGVFNAGGFGVYSNHIIAYVRSLSGLATEKPPQDNPLMIGDAFSYRLLVVNAPIALDTNTLDPSSPFYSAYSYRISQNQRECRLTFFWPLLPNGNIGNEPPLTYRTTVAGQLAGNYYNNNYWLYFYQPQTFNVATNLP